MSGKMLTAKDAADRLGVPVKTVYKLTAERQLAHYRIGRAVRIAEADLDKYLAGCYKAQEAPVAASLAPEIKTAPVKGQSGAAARRAARAARANYEAGYTGLDCLNRRAQ